MATVFTKIIRGDIPCHKVAETDRYLAFLDINPVAEGHILCVPKQETDYIFDLEDDLLGGLFIFAKKVGRAAESVIDCQRVGVLVVGTEVPHAHVHIIPFQNHKQMHLGAPKLEFSQEELAATAQKIATAYRDSDV